VTTVLLTAFEPFDGAASNPSIDVVRRVLDGWDRPERLVTAVLPVSFRGAEIDLQALLAVHQPAVAVGVGLAARRPRPALERFALNLCDARIADNDGDQPSDRAVLAGGPLAVATSLPVKATVARMRAEGVDAELSTTAGTFVCNASFYLLATWAQQTPGRRAGFVHVPGSEPGASAAVVRASVEDALDLDRDLDLPVGGSD
jgi:pyroglutamyl-peptidase